MYFFVSPYLVISLFDYFTIYWIYVNDDFILQFEFYSTSPSLTLARRKNLPWTELEEDTLKVPRASRFPMCSI